MNAVEVVNEIPYFEYRVINDLVHAHSKELGDSLRAIIAFGDLKTRGGTFDIELLEVVDDWQGPPQIQSADSPEVPMRGKLFLNFLSTAEFEAICTPPVPGRVPPELLRRVLNGYEIVYEVPAGFARKLLNRAQDQSGEQGHGQYIDDPRRLPAQTRR